MPAHRLSDAGTPIRRFDVVGRDAITVYHFIRHVALSARDIEGVSSGNCIGVNHMGPPLERDHALPVDVHATAELTDDDLNQIELFIDELHNEQEAQRRRDFGNYVIHPHTVLSPDGSFRRFSCVGYVVEAYAEAGIDLIDTTGELPQVDLATLFNAYSELQRLEQNPRLRGRYPAPDREELGLSGDGPWAVLLPGYIFHSMARQADEIRSTPYQPVHGDERFPRDQ